MLPRYDNLEQLQPADIQSLITARVPEDLRLEFKAGGAYAGDSGIREWCKDISALANSEGGCVVLGIEENDGVAERIGGVPGDADLVITRLLQIAEASLRPRLRIRHKRVLVPPSTTVVVFGTPPSRFGPHMSVASGDKRFYKRSGVHVEAMDVDELRRSFLTSRSAEETALSIHRDHVETRSDGCFRLILDCVVLPEEDDRFDPADPRVREMVREKLAGHAWDVLEGRIAFDGLVLTSTGKEPNRVRVRRSGTQLTEMFLESADRLVPSEWLPRKLIDTLGAMLRVHQVLSAPGTAYLCLTMVGTHGWRLTSGRYTESKPIDQHLLEFPPILIEAETTDALRLAVPWLDRLWQAFGFEKSPLIDAQTGNPDWKRVERWGRI